MNVAAALTQHRGNISATAKKFGVHRSSVQQLIDGSPELQRVLKDAREGMKDEAESALYKAVRDCQPWAVCFYLKTQAKDRGYVEKSEIDLTAARRLVIEEEVVEPGGGNPAGEAAPGPG